MRRLLAATLVAWMALSFAGMAAQLPPVNDASPLTLTVPNGTTTLVPQAVGVPGVYNFNPSAFVHYRLAVGKMLRGTANVRVCALGDSTTFGFGSVAAAPATARLNGWPPAAAALLTARGIPSGSQNMFGSAGSGTATPSGLPANDNRLVIPSNWGTSVSGLAEYAYSTASTGAMTFTPNAPVDTFDVYYIQNGGTGTAALSIDGGTATNVNTNGSGAIVKATVTAGSAGTHTLSINWSAGGTIYIIGIDAYPSATKQISLFNLGWYSSKASNWNNGDASFYSHLNSLIAIKCDLTIIILGINDYVSAGETPTQFQTNMQAIITAAQTTSDVVLATVVPSNPAYSSGAALVNQALIRQITFNLALSNNLPLVDVNARLGSYTIMNGNGEMIDALHPNALGYTEMARPIAQMLMQAM